VDELWQVAVLDTKFYHNFHKVMGTFVHYAPPLDAEKEANSAFREVYEKFFRETPLGPPPPPIPTHTFNEMMSTTLPYLSLDL
jgi:hypothetical protein